ncbi:MAG: RsiV family protein [Muribaculaceae bacterium]|nr:RsiV family protein [Muribaculaceae bacterium]
MKKLTYGAFAALAVLASCNNGASKNGDDETLPKVELMSYQYDAIAEVVEGDTLPQPGSKYVRVSGEGVMPTRIGNRDLSQLRDSLEQLGAISFVTTDKVEPRLDPTMVISSLSSDDVNACGSAYNSLTVSLVSPRLLVWKDYCANYVCGAAHGSYRTAFVNYRVSDGKILSVSDLMRPGYEEKLSNLIRKQLKDDKVDLLVPLDEVPIPDVFEITSNGIRFVYQIYEIAPYSSGEVSVNFDAYELEDVLAPGMISFICGLPE